jgi:hypothetical protein
LCGDESGVIVDVVTGVAPVVEGALVITLAILMFGLWWRQKWWSCVVVVDYSDFGGYW